jgi:hypothetical protein
MARVRLRLNDEGPLPAADAEKRMTPAMKEMASVEQLLERVQELERRVAAIEGRPAEKTSTSQTMAASAVAKPAMGAETWQGFPSPKGGAVPVIGKAVLGIAGAYLLRAMAESSAIPKVPVLIAAIVYASLWMIWAVRTHENRIASVTYGLTSVMILAPMLWESTVRFGFLPAGFSGLILGGFFVLALQQTWRRELTLVPWVATLATVITALALILETHAIVPLTVALLAVAAANEICACYGEHTALRMLPAVAADIAVLLLVYVMSAGAGGAASFGSPPAGTVIALWVTLIAIYIGSIGVRCFWRRERITVVDIVQGTLAFAIAVYGAVQTPYAMVAPALGVFLLILAQGCFWGTLSRFMEEADGHNRRVCATWAAVLLVAGSDLLFPPHVEVIFLCVATVFSTVLYTRLLKVSLGLHASVFLVAGVVASSLPAFVTASLTGRVLASPKWDVWLIAVTAAVCYGMGSRTAEVGKRRGLWVVPAITMGVTGTALAVVGIVWATSGQMEMAASRLSVIRTMVTCALAAAFAFAGYRGKRIELGWVAYAAVGLGTLKLLMEDLRYGNPASLVVSLLFYGLILIVLPRLARKRVEA